MIKFYKITKHNLDDIVQLDAGDKGKYIATNSYTISEASLNNHLNYVRVISLKDKNITKNKQTYIGLFYFIPINKHKILIQRFMIDKKYQNKGMGKLAFKKLLDYLKKHWDVKKIELSTNNPKAKEMYTQFGFTKDVSKHARNFYKKYKEDIMYLNLDT